MDGGTISVLAAFSECWVVMVLDCTREGELVASAVVDWVVVAVDVDWDVVAAVVAVSSSSNQSSPSLAPESALVVVIVVDVVETCKVAVLLEIVLS